MATYNERGFLESYVWHKDKTVKSSIDTYDENGGMLKGRVDATWKFWEDPNILVKHYVIHKSNGAVNRLDREGLNLAMNWTEEYRGQFGYIGYFDRTSVLDGGVGVIALSIEYVDMNGWVEVYPEKPESMKQQMPDNERAVYIKTPPRKSFRILAKVGSNYDDTDVDFDVPFDLQNQNAWINFDTSNYCTVKMQEPDLCLVSLISGGSFEKVWIRYNK